jgi:hypothetical protein
VIRLAAHYIYPALCGIVWINIQSALWQHLMAYYLFGLSANIIVFWHRKCYNLFLHLECYHLLFALQVPSSSFGLTSTITAYFFAGLMVAPLWAVISSILPLCCTPLDNIISYLALLAILSSILPHDRTPLVILFSTQPNGLPFWKNIFLFGPTVAPLQAKFFL